VDRLMSRLSITTIKELCKPIGREGFAFDFPLETGKINPDDLEPLVGKKVYIQTNGGKFDFIDKEYDHSVELDGFSSTKIYVKARNKTKDRMELVEVTFDTLTMIEWTEPIVKRITVREGARVI
jgi:hypothetical protein